MARWVGVIAHRAEIVERLSTEAADRGRRAGAEELVTVVAHDIRNYLGPIHGRIVLLKQRAAREKLEMFRRDAELAERSCLRLGRLVTDLLDVGRIEQGLFELQRVPLDLAALVREVAGAIESPNAPVLVEGEPELVVDGDPVRLRQALENVLSNAAKYSPPGATIRVVTSLARGAGGEARAAVAISDRGPGMPPAGVPRLHQVRTRKRLEGPRARALPRSGDRPHARRRARAHDRPGAWDHGLVPLSGARRLVTASSAEARAMI